MDFSQRLQHRERYSHVRENENGMLLIDYMTKNFLRFNRTQWLAKIAEKRISVNGTIAVADTELKKHDRVSLLEDLTIEPQVNLSFETLYKDEHLLVFNKGADLCVHPTGVFYQNTLWYQAGKKYGELFFVGRLDRETSGIVAAARSKKIAAMMQTPDFEIYREYHVLVHGTFDRYVHAAGFLTPDTASSVPKKRRFTFNETDNSEHCDTELFPLAVYPGGFSRVKAVLHSGRMHQIRATMFSLGFPVVGDKLYGTDEELYHKISTQSFTENDRKKLILPHQALHCIKLEFPHPVSGKKISVTAPEPDWATCANDGFSDSKNC